MGSIQSLRSWALASRANEDTDLQTSGFLGGVNKSLGTQIVGIIDQLQGVIATRTKVYNDLVCSITKTIDGRDGVASKAILGAFRGFNNAQTIIALAVSVASGAKRASTLALPIIKILADAVTATLTSMGIKKSVESAVYDYEKMMSQLGYLQSTTTYIGPTGLLTTVKSANLTSGASRFLDTRNSLMPKFRLYDDFTNGVDGNYVEYNLKGSVGSLRRT